MDNTDYIKSDGEHRKQSVSFEEEPVEFCRLIYAEASDRADQIKDINIKNRLLYEGKCDLIEERRNHARVRRSAIYINELTPAIETRIGEIIAKLEQDEHPIQIRPKALNPTDNDIRQASWMQHEINQQLKDNGYLLDGFQEHIISAEIYRSPSCVKVDWEERQVDVPEVKEPSIMAQVGSILTRRPIGQPKVTWKKKNIGRPIIDLLDVDEWLYEPGRSDLEKTSTYAIHRQFVEPHELIALTKENDWDVKAAERYLDGLAEAESDTSMSSETSVQDSINSEKGTPYESPTRDGKVMIGEFYVVTYDEVGQRSVKTIVLVGNTEVLKPAHKAHLGFEFPFVPICAHNLPKTMEGLSSVDKGKTHQLLYAELYNSIIDNVTYQLFSPQLKQLGVEFTEDPIVEPLAFWEISDIDGIKPLVQNRQMYPELVSLINQVSSKIRDILNAQDIQQGFQSRQYEKATSTKLRSMGAEKRALPTHRHYANAIIEVVERVIALNQRYNEEGVSYVLDVTVDVPALTSVKDLDTEIQETLLLIAQAVQNPVYQNPVGQLKIRNMMEDLVRLMKKKGVERFVPSEEEIKQVIKIQTEQQIAELERQGAAEQLGVVASQEEMDIQKKNAENKAQSKQGGNKDANVRA